MFKNIRIYRKLKSKRYVDALQLLPEDNEISPIQLSYRAHCYFRLGQYEKAEQDFDRLKEFKNYVYFAFNNKGYMYLEQFLFDKAITELQKAVEMHPKQSFSLNNLGHAYMLTGKIEDGVKMVEDAIKLDRFNYYAIRNIGIYYLLKKQYSDALTVFLKAKNKDKTIDDIENYILVCKYHLGNKNNKQELINDLSDAELARFEIILQNFT